MTARVDHFSSIEHIDCLMNDFMPAVKKFSNHLDKFVLDNENMREGFIKFDSVLGLKANKC